MQQVIHLNVFGYDKARARTNALPFSGPQGNDILQRYVIQTSDAETTSSTDSW